MDRHTVIFQSYAYDILFKKSQPDLILVTHDVSKIVN